MNMFVGSFNCTSNILSLYLRDSIISTEILEAMNSDTKLLNITVACFLLKKIIQALLIKINTPFEIFLLLYSLYDLHQQKNALWLSHPLVLGAICNCFLGIFIKVFPIILLKHLLRNEGFWTIKSKFSLVF